MRGAVLVASLVGVLLAGSVGAASTARVTITDAALNPKVARISAPGSVTWTNRGTFTHVVVSTTNAFKPLIINVGKSKTVRFARAGNYPYLVDGKRCGFVVAGSAKPGKNCSFVGGGGSPPPPPQGSGVEKKIIRYDVDVIASLHTVEDISGNIAQNNGTLDRKLDWTAKWRRLEVQVQTVGSASYFSVKRASARRGTITGELKYSDSRPASGPCRGEITYSGYKAEALVNGSKPERGERSVSFEAAAVNPSAIDELTHSTQKAKCNDRQLGLPRWADETRLIVQGVHIHHPPGYSIHPMDTRWSREAARGTPFPLDRFLANRGFTLDTGVRTSTFSEEGYSERFTGRARYVFKPVR